MRDLSERFWSKVDRSAGTGACWPWMGYRKAGGYGHTTWQGRLQLTHRIAFALTCGDVPPDMCVMHVCDNPPCCNPAHLKLGTHADNMHDCALKGRNAMSKPSVREKALTALRDPAVRETIRQRAHTRRLTWEQVREIRALWQSGAYSQAALAARFGVVVGTIGFIIRNQTWIEG